MDRQLYDKVSIWFEERREAIAADIMRLVRIESISRPGADGTPFGEGCLRALEEMLAIGRKHGFYTENYGNMVGSIGSRDKNWENLIGFWNHMDVVPVGNGWEYAPFSPQVREGFLIGRGAQDNKGPAVGILYMMQCLRELHVGLKHELCLFVGTDEERGMADMEYYTANFSTPKLSMIADSGFPVCYGEKGILEGRMVTARCVTEQILEVSGGSASNMIPDRAAVLLKDSEALREELGRLSGADLGDGAARKAKFGEEGDAQSGELSAGGAKTAGSRETEAEKGVGAESGSGIEWRAEPEGIRIIGHGTSRHSAFPEGSVNAIHVLSAFLMRLKALSEDDRTIFANVERLSREYYGRETGIAYEDEVSGKTTCAATVLGMEDRHLCLTLNIRYAITAKDEEDIRALEACGTENGMEWQMERNSKPNYFPKEHPAVERLTNLYNEITGRDTRSFVMGGGTYARKLPNAFAYGIGGMQENDADREARRCLFKPGHGGAHEPDEALNLRLLLEAMKIYTMAVVELNEVEL